MQFSLLRLSQKTNNTMILERVEQSSVSYSL